LTTSTTERRPTNRATATAPCGLSASLATRQGHRPAVACVPERFPDKLGDRCAHFRIAFGNIANPRNQRTFYTTLVPPNVICGDTVPTIVFDGGYEWAYLPWLAVANSFTMDALVRRKLSSPHMTFTVLDSLPFPRPALTDAIVQSDRAGGVAACLHRSGNDAVLELHGRARLRRGSRRRDCATHCPRRAERTRHGPRELTPSSPPASSTSPRWNCLTSSTPSTCSAAAMKKRTVNSAQRN